MPREREREREGGRGRGRRHSSARVGGQRKGGRQTETEKV